MKLSVVTVCLNAENCIALTMESVLNQTVPVYEYILVDGGSIDRTNEIIEEYKEKFLEKGIRFINISEKDNGISDAFNKGIRLSTGELIGIINADDELMPETCGYLNEVYSDSFDIYYGDCIWVDEKKNVQYARKPSVKLKKLFYSFPMIHPSTFVKKSIYENFGCFNVDFRFCMDKEIMTRFYISGCRFRYCPKELTRFKAGGVSDKNLVKVLKESSGHSIRCGKPKVFVYLYNFAVCLRYKLSEKLKRTFVYKLLKKADKIS